MPGNILTLRSWCQIFYRIALASGYGKGRNPVISILYVDDEPDLLEIARLFLEETAGIHVATFTSAQDALAAPEFASYDAIVSDYQMPGMDGIAFLKVVRERYSSIPFILFTGRGREEIVIDAINNGADFYLQKGGEVRAQFAELAHKIRQAVSRRQAEISLIESEKRLADIIDFLPDATFAIDRDGTVIAWNRAIEEMSGIAAEEITGKGDFAYAIPFYGTRRPILIDHVFKTDKEITPYYNIISRDGASITAETSLPHPKGTQITVLAKASPLYNKEGELTGAIESIRDITERKKADDELRAAYEQISASEEELREQFDVLAESEKSVKENAARLAFMLGFYERSGEDPKVLMDYAVEGAGIITDSPLGYLAFLNEDESELSMYAWSKSAMEECSIRDKPLVYKTRDTGLWGEAVRRRCPVITNDYAAPDPLKKGYPKGHPVIVRHMNVPVIENGRVVIVAGVANKSHDYTQDDARQLTLLITGLWQVLRQQKIKKDLAQSEENYRSVIQFSPFGMHFYELLPEGDLIFTGSNPAADRLLNINHNPLIGKKIEDAFPGLAGTEIPGQYRKVAAEGGVWHQDQTFYVRGTIRRAYAVQAFRIRPGIMVAAFTDITDRMRAEEALRQKTEELDRFFNASLDLFCIADTNGYFRRLNPEWERALGYTLADLEGHRFLDFVHPDDLPATLDAVSRLKDQVQILNFTNRYRHRNGTYRWIEWRSHPVGDLIFAAARDVTHHRETEDALRESEERYRTIFENIQDVYYRSDLDGNLIMASPSVLPLLGYDAIDELVGKNIAYQILQHPQERAALLEALARDGSVTNYDVELRRRDGSLVTVSTSSHVFYDHDGKPAGVEGIFHDVTAVRKAQQQLHLLAGLLEISPASITVHSDDGTFLYANERTFELHGYTKEEFMALNLQELDVPESAEHIAERIELLQSKGEVSFDVEHFRKDGSRIPLHIVIRKIRWDSLDAIMSVATEISKSPLNNHRP